MAVKIRLAQNPDGQWQADVLHDGKDHHAVSSTPWGALIELGYYWKSVAQTPPSDIEALFRLQMGAPVK